MESWAMVRAITLMVRAMVWATTLTVRATTVPTLMNMVITTCTSLGPMGWAWVWAKERAHLWAMLWALERHMGDMVAMEWALRVALLTRNNTVGGRPWVVTVAAVTAATAVMTSVTAKLLQGFMCSSLAYEKEEIELYFPVL
ncbi:uncharacterized protein LOC107855327 [Capsicum annuum]|uniref:uncharacterized protein LOC107855327 n=1 Tax=Capsicum annuum TaxID=4072 RepID=UPI001FB075C9|nr:uncharacterized protein LOC107855327 [Capsicum annuum]